MNTFKRFRRAAAALFACALWAVSAAFAAVPERISYQGTLRKEGILFSGTVPMEFRITNFNGGTVYWTSNSTDVVVTGGLFRYTLGSPNEASFATIDWNSVDAYVQVLLDGGWLPPEPLFSSAYALNAKTANNSQGDFTVRDGYIRLSTTTGNIGLVFQDGTTQYTSASPVWSVSGTDVYISSNTYGNAGVGNAAPEARLDVQAAAGGYPQIWRDSSGVIQSSMNAAGFIFADGSKLRNLPSTADSLGSHVATQTVNMGGYQLSNAGAVTASSYTATNALGVSAAQLRLAANAVVSSATAAQYGGVYVSTNVSIAGKYYGDGSALSNLPIPANIMTLDTNQIVSGVKTVTSSLTVTSAQGLRSAHYDLATGVMLSSASATQQGGLYVSSNIYITGKYYGDGSGLSGVVGLDNLGNHTLSQNMIGGAYWFSNDGTSKGVKVDANGRVNLGSSGTSATGTVDVRASGAETYAQVWRNIGGAAVSSMSVGGVLYADGSGLRNVSLGNLSINQNLNMANKDIVSVSTISVSTITSAGSSVTFNKYVSLTSLSGSGDRCVYADNTGTLQLAGSVCGTVAGTDNLGNHTATQDLKMAAYNILNAASVTASSYTATNALGITSARMRLANNIIVSSETQAALGAGVRVSTNIYIVGFSSAVKYYGDGSALTGITGVADDLGNHTATQDLNMAAKDIVGVSTISVSSITSPGASVTFGKDVTITNLVGGSNRCVYVDAGGVLRAELDDCGTPSGAADSLGTHIATQDLNMNAHGIINGAAVTASSYTAVAPLGIGAAQLNLADNVMISSATAAQYGGVFVSSNIYTAGTFYGGGVTLSADLNVTGGNITNSYLVGSGNRCVYADLNGVLRVKTSDCGTSTGGDQMGDHVMTQNLQTMGFWITRNGGPDGLMLDGNQNLGIGVAAPEARLDVWGPGVGGLYTQIWRNSGGAIVSSMSAAGYLKAVKFIGDGSQLTGVSFNPILNQNMQAGAYWISGDGDNEGMVVDASGNVGVNVAAPGARLDVKAAGVGTYGQIWRDSSGVIQASMSGTGYIYADGSKLRNLPAADNLGNHTATANLNMGAYQITGTGAVTVASYTATNALGIAAAQMRLAANTIVSSAPAAQYGGVYVSSNIYVAGKYYGDGSGLTGVTGMDGLGNHIATQTLSMAGYDIVNVSTISVSSITSAGGTVTLGSKLYMAGDIQSTRLSGNGTRCIQVDNSGMFTISPYTGDCGSASGLDNMGNHTMTMNLKVGDHWISYAGGNSGLSVNTSSNVGVGIFSAGTRLDVQPDASDGYVQFWRNSAGVIQASMSATGALYADGAGLRNVFANPAAAMLDMNDLPIANAPQLGLSAGVTVSSETDSALGAGLRVSSNVYIVGFSSATKYYGDGSALTGVASGGFPSPVTTDLDMNGYKIVNVTTMTISSITVPSGSGLVVSTHTYILGNLSATKYYGNGSTLSGIVANPMTADLNMNTKSISNALDVSATGIISGLKLKFVPTNLEISQANKPMGGLEISTHQYVTGSLMVSSHSTFGNTAPSPLTDTSLLLNETFTELTLNNIGLSAVALVNPATDPGPGLSVIGASFMAGIASGNAYSFDSIVGLKSGGWAQTNQTVTGSYGVFVQNMQSAGTVVNNYGVMVSSPDLTVGTITNNYGIFIKDHSGVGTTLNYNLFSAGLGSKNVFEGMVSIGNIAADSPAQTTEPLQIKATSGDVAIRINSGAATDRYCVIKFNNGPTCSVGAQLGSHNNMSLCMECTDLTP